MHFMHVSCKIPVDENSNCPVAHIFLSKSLDSRQTIIVGSIIGFFFRLLTYHTNHDSPTICMDRIESKFDNFGFLLDTLLKISR